MSLGNMGAALLRLLQLTGFAALVASGFAGPNASAPGLLRITGSDRGKAVVEPDPIALGLLKQRAQHVQVKQIPLADGSTADFELERFNVFTPDAEVYGFDGNTTSAVRGDEPVTYKGRNPADPTQVAFVSALGDELTMAVSDKKQLTLVRPDRSQGGGKLRHLLGKAEPEDLKAFSCAADALPRVKPHLRAETEPVSVATYDATTSSYETAAAITGPTLEAKVFIDVGYPLFTQRFSSNQTAARDYVANLVGAVSAIYERDISTVISIKDLVIWTSTDPFGTQSTDHQLSNYRSYNMSHRDSTSRDATHLLTYAPSLGGIAYIEALCNHDYDCGVSNLDADLNFPVSGYHWDMYVMAHELGHTFGSPHTHCYSPPIDCCYVENGCSGCTSAHAQVGTIMSYCHLNGSIAMYFHSRCIDVMRSTAEQSSCMGAYTAPAGGPDATAEWGSGLKDAARETSKTTSLGTSYRVLGTLNAQNLGGSPTGLMDTYELYLSSDAKLDAGDPLIYTAKLPILKPAPAGGIPKIKKIKVKVIMPNTSVGKYLIAALNAFGDTDTTNSVAVSTPIK